MRTSFHHQPEAQHPNFQLLTSWQADYPIYGSFATEAVEATSGSMSASPGKRTNCSDPLQVRLVPSGLMHRSKRRTWVARAGERGTIICLDTSS
jgi:hypothetical protein